MMSVVQHDDGEYSRTQMADEKTKIDNSDDLFSFCKSCQISVACKINKALHFEMKMAEVDPTEGNSILSGIMLHTPLAVGDTFLIVDQASDAVTDGCKYRIRVLYKTRAYVILEQQYLHWDRRLVEPIAVSHRLVKIVW